jgi:predicted NBD/HSP70 family sugar kinase
MSEGSLLSAEPKITAPLDPGFQPFSLASRRFREAVATAAKKQKLAISLERNAGLVTRWDLEVLPSDARYDVDSLRYVERTIKFLLWARGGWKLYLAGSQQLCEQIRECYSTTGTRAFDVDLMAKVYGRPFEVCIARHGELPLERDSTVALGGHLDGCRIGFDLGASDYKLAAVINGEPVFSTEIPWNPKDEADPRYHYHAINEGLKLAASKLPRVDAIGGSSAGVIVDNQVMVASLFRSVPLAEFERLVKPMFLTLQKEWGVPVAVLNDGDVTALAGAMSLKEKAMLGIAMGSSQAGGFLDRNGTITGWLNELAFAPVDLNPHAAIDEWSGDAGVGALYFSQQAVNKLAVAAGWNFPEEMGLPERLKVAQEKVVSGDPVAQKIFESIGVYLGYSIPLYADFYDFRNLLILGRVTSGEGGEILLRKAQEVLRMEFAGLSERIKLVVPDEKSRRVGQAVAAASLPAI